MSKTGAAREKCNFYKSKKSCEIVAMGSGGGRDKETNPDSPPSRPTLKTDLLTTKLRPPTEALLHIRNISPNRQIGLSTGKKKLRSRSFLMIWPILRLFRSILGTMIGTHRTQNSKGRAKSHKRKRTYKT